jgi:hypothetical protein
MQFEADHHFSAPPEAVIALLVDPEFHEQLELPDLSRPEVIQTDLGDPALLSLRYEFVGHLDAPARRLLGRRRLTWLQELRIDRATRAGQLTFASESSPDRLHGHADFTLEGEDESGCFRRLQGELVVAVPLIGGQAERRIVPGIRRRLDIEAHALATRLSAGPT